MFIVDSKIALNYLDEEYHDTSMHGNRIRLGVIIYAFNIDLGWCMFMRLIFENMLVQAKVKNISFVQNMKGFYSKAWYSHTIPAIYC